MKISVRLFTVTFCVLIGFSINASAQRRQAPAPAARPVVREMPTARQMLPTVTTTRQAPNVRDFPGGGEVNTTIARPEDVRPHPGEGSNRIDNMQKKQQEVIRNGVATGDISREELEILLREQKAIYQKEREYKADGEFTTEEKKEIARLLKEAGKHIRRADNN